MSAVLRHMNEGIPMSSASNASRAKPTLVFIHGSGDDAQIWDALIACLPQYTALALDLPGHGARTDDPGPAAMTVEDYAASVSDELTRRGTDNACLVGHSLGSAVALRLAVDAPELVGRLVLVGAGARLRVLPAVLAEAATDAAAAKGKLVELAFAPAHGAEARAMIEQSPPPTPGILYRDLAACDGFDMMAELAQIRQPALILTGEEDRLTPPKYGNFLAEHIGNARFAIIPNAGHYAQIEAPAACAEAISAWLG
jgi:pimeloyl-ACP methyl ester carboxylesterase